MTHNSRRVTRGRREVLRAALLTCSLALVPAAGAAAQDVRILTRPEVERRFAIEVSDRPMIGVTTVGESERGDTLGLRIEEVTPGSPAEKAGLKAGDRLQAVNGVSLRADRADAGEEDYAGVLNRRLQRAVQATKPGESVTLRVLSGGSVREVRVTPVKASELADERPAMLRWRGESGDRAVLGLTARSTGSARDTIGVFVQSVVRDGPAERAGIVEGDRIASINGVSLRVAREDAEDAAVGQARAERLSREVGRLKAGDTAELTVVTAGRTRTVRVTTVKASDLPEHEGGIFTMRVPPLELMRELPLKRELPEGALRVDRERPDVRVIVPQMRRRIEEGMSRARPIVIRRSVRTEI